jgi:lysophospholipase L1-like esterase
MGLRNIVASGCLAAAGAVVLAAGAQPAPATRFRFHFGPGAAPAGYVQVLPATPYSADRGFGFEPGPPQVFFSVAVPEGNYKVTVTLGAEDSPGETTVFAELRRLMLERVETRPGQRQTRSFVVNVRRPEIAGGGTVRLKDREKTSEAWAWDDRLTLEFNGARPAVAALEVERVSVPTVFLLGDSTMCDQPLEPYSSWGQMLTRFIKSDVAVANHAESGESIASSLSARRFDKVWSEMKRGDYLFVQFGHNDMKSTQPGALETYAADLGRIVDETRARGGIAVLLTSVSRRTFDPTGTTITDSFQGYTQAVRAVARGRSVALIDLQTASATLYEALGPERSHLAFATMQEGTHHNAYGSYQVAKCVLNGIRSARIGLAALIADFDRFDPAKPDPLDEFRLPKSHRAAGVTPLGG